MMSNTLDPVEIQGHGIAAWMEANGQALSRWVELTAAELDMLPQRLGMPVKLVLAEAPAQPGGPMPIDLESAKVTVKAETKKRKRTAPPVSQMDALEF